MPFIRTLLLLLVLVSCSKARAASLAPGEPLGHELVAGLIEDELARRGEGERFETVVEQPVMPLANRARSAAEVSLTDLSHEPRSGRFIAGLHVELASGEASRIELRGRARPLLEISVPAQRIERGQTIAAEDVQSQWVSRGSLPKGTAELPDDLIGREARRTLAPGRAIRLTDLVVPQLVRRGEPVTILLASGGLELSMLGEALDSGSEGEAVRVVNPSSSQVRKGIVAGPKLVRITSLSGASP
jgi:flagella basal body P-ring formation protein FlgA